jgi:hypothetical protein
MYSGEMLTLFSHTGHVIGDVTLVQKVLGIRGTAGIFLVHNTYIYSMQPQRPKEGPSISA